MNRMECWNVGMLARLGATHIQIADSVIFEIYSLKRIFRMIGLAKECWVWKADNGLFLI